MHWTTGDSSGGDDGLGGTEALAGINAGDGYNYHIIPGSQTPSIINITQTSNIGTPGVWMFSFKCMYCVYGIKCIFIVTNVTGLYAISQQEPPFPKYCETG